ncbi:MAG: hypothetical protein ABI442_21895 [Gemmatimonadaceae bacterium]
MGPRDGIARRDARSTRADDALPKRHERFATHHRGVRSPAHGVRAFFIDRLARRSAVVTVPRVRDDESDVEKHSSDRARTTSTESRDSATPPNYLTIKNSLTMPARNPTITARRPIAPREALRPIRGAALRPRFLPLPRA